VTAISIWENKKDADNYNTNTYPQVLKTLARFIEGTPQVHTFDVVTSTIQKHELVTAEETLWSLLGTRRRSYFRLLGPANDMRLIAQKDRAGV
jgi:hypothetical protein